MVGPAFARLDGARREPEETAGKAGVRRGRTVVSQGLLKWLDDNVDRWPWRLWVVDELSGYKNPGSVRSAC